jgi:sorbitol-specific phosphotransferase system component IIBC
LATTINTNATGGWGYHLDVTKKQAQQILNATEGDIIPLNGKDETITVGSDTMNHYRNKEDGGNTSEELIASDFREQLQKV